MCAPLMHLNGLIGLHKSMIFVGKHLFLWRAKSKHHCNMTENQSIYSPPKSQVVTALAQEGLELSLPETPHKLSVGDSLSSAWELTKKNFGWFLLFGLIYFGIIMIVSTVFSLLSFAVMMPGLISGEGNAAMGTSAIIIGQVIGSVVQQVAITVVQAWLGVGAFKGILAVAKTGHVEFGDFFKVSKKAFGHTLLGTLCIMFGTLLLFTLIGGGVFLAMGMSFADLANLEDPDTLLPFIAWLYGGFAVLGLIFIYPFVRFSYYTMVIADKEVNFVQALKHSWKMTRGNFWPIIGLGIVMYLFALISMIPLGLGLLWTMPMFAILSGVIYVYLHNGSAAAQIESV